MNNFKVVKKSELKKFLFEKGIECSDLVDIVHDAASSLASDANNEGIDGQINFLMDTCGWTTEDIINKI
jgi:CO dehydrogenase/acetyl-CoA synthase epsilon subunit